MFICSTGLIMSPKFLAQHLRVLAGGLVVTVLSKTVLVGRTSPYSAAHCLHRCWSLQCLSCCPHDPSAVAATTLPCRQRSL